MSRMITEEGLQRLDEALAWIEEHPEQHDQSNWIQRTDCGTAYCLAGAVVHLAGAEPSWYDDREVSATDMVVYGAEKRTVGGLAQQLLGITYTERLMLFDEDNTVADLRARRDRLAASLVGSQESTGATS